jgi:hypothetical protein
MVAARRIASARAASSVFMNLLSERREHGGSTPRPQVAMCRFVL